MTPTEIAEEVVARLQACLPTHDGPVALHEPEIAERDWELVHDCLDSGWVSTGGPYVSRFEDALTEATGSAHAVACVNATSAIALALLVAGVEPGDEVLVPSLSFVATANAVRHVGATPHFVDASEVTLGVDPPSLSRHLREIALSERGRCVNRSSGRRISALVPVHVFGHPAAMDPLQDVAAEFGLAVVEDAAEALGSRYRDRHCGTFGALGVLSFNGNKIVTTGGGGAILTQDEHMAVRARHLSTTAKVPHPWEYRHDEVGYNHRLPGINAALGCAQLERLEQFVEQKRRLAGRYQQEFESLEHVEFFREPPRSRSNYWLNAIKVPSPEARDLVLQHTNRAGFLTRPAWSPLHRLPMYIDSPRASLPVTEALTDRIVNLPSSAKLA